MTADSVRAFVRLVVAVGRTSASLLSGAPSLRHPANGGATAFRAGVAALTPLFTPLVSSGQSKSEE